MEVVAGFGDPGIIVVTRHAGPWMKDAETIGMINTVTANQRIIFMMMSDDDVLSPVCHSMCHSSHTVVPLILIISRHLNE